MVFLFPSALVILLYQDLIWFNSNYCTVIQELWVWLSFDFLLSYVLFWLVLLWLCTMASLLGSLVFSFCYFPLVFRIYRFVSMLFLPSPVSPCIVLSVCFLPLCLVLCYFLQVLVSRVLFLSFICVCWLHSAVSYYPCIVSSSCSFLTL